MNRVLLGLICLLPLAACQGTGKPPKQETMVRLGDMPESYAQLWQAWLLDDPRYSSLRNAAKQDPAQIQFLVENLIGVMLGEVSWGRVLSGPPGAPTTLERARIELLNLRTASVVALTEVLVLGSGLGPVAVEDLLIEIAGPAVGPLLLQLARIDNAMARRRASHTLAEIAFQRIPAGMDTGPIRFALAERLHGDEDWIVRSQCALALAAWGRSTHGDMAETSRQIAPALLDEDAGVRKDAIQALGRLGDPRVLPALINHLERSINAGRMGETVTTQKTLSALTHSGRSHTPAQWRAWWRDQRPKVLAHFDAQAKRRQ
ncbi:MAG: HEAT repeat domain-containing protein [bacterium]|nr:HEAT repeat domain-containing protein [bacterium]